MDRTDQFTRLFDGLVGLSHAGYAIGLHLSFTTSKYIFQTYSRAWRDEYSDKGLILSDPTVSWGLANQGAIRWSELRENDAGGVIEAANEFGLRYGVTISVVGDKSRSLGSFARQDADFGDADIRILTDKLQKMHVLTLDVVPDSPDDRKIRRFAASISGAELHGL